MESNKKPMKKSLVATIVFVIIVLIFTFFSKTLYNMNLPSVKYANPTYGALKRLFTCEAVAAAKKEYALYAPCVQKVVEVLVKEGDFVQKDQVLIRLDVSGLENDLLQLELEKQQLKDSKKYLSSKTYKLSMIVLDKKINDKKAEIDGSVIIAPADGYLTALFAQTGMTANTSEPLVNLGSVEEGLQVVLNVTQKQATYFELNDRLDIYVPILNRTYEGSVRQVRAAQNGNMDVLVDLKDPLNEVQAGQLAEVSFTKMSGYYITLVPVGALHSDANRDYIFKIETVQGPLGDEYRLYKMFVRVLDQDDTNAAIDTQLYSGDRIVTESDQELFGGRIKIMED